MKEGFRQSMDWLHTWLGLSVGWILFFVYFTGTLGYVDTEIDYVNLMPGMSAPTATYLDRVQEFTRDLTLPTFHACRIIDAATARHAIPPASACVRSQLR